LYSTLLCKPYVGDPVQAMTLLHAEAFVTGVTAARAVTSRMRFAALVMSCIKDAQAKLML
jgi:hypothetical protein